MSLSLRVEISSPSTVTKRAENTRALTVVCGALAVYSLFSLAGWPVLNATPAPCGTPQCLAIIPPGLEVCVCLSGEPFFPIDIHHIADRSASFVPLTAQGYRTPLERGHDILSGSPPRKIVIDEPHMAPNRCPQTQTSKPEGGPKTQRGATRRRGRALYRIGYAP